MAVRALLSRLGALVLLALIPSGWYYALGTRYAAPIDVRPANGTYVVTNVRSDAARAAGIRVGDKVDLTGLSMRGRFLVTSGSRWAPVSYPIVHGTTRHDVTLPDVATEVGWGYAVPALVSAFLSIISLVVGAIVLWRRPGLLAFAIAVYCTGSIFSARVIMLASVLPDGLFAVVFVLALVVIAAAPPFALIAFAMRFPREPESGRGRSAMHVLDAALVLACVGYAVRYATVSTIFDAADWRLDVLPTFVATVVVAVIAGYRYARSRGDDRRRLGWVLAGTVVSGVAYALVTGDTIGPVGLYELPTVVLYAALFSQVALPLALAYAILRHRVLDVGFVLNRTVVYAVVTAALVIAVSFVDWIIGRVLSGSRLATVLEAAITIAFGVALNWFHARVDRLVDRVLFRERYRAAERIESRMRALDYASSAATVDAALVAEAAAVLRLSSAAIFRETATNRFERAAAVGWDGCASELDAEHVLVRMLRADERTVTFDDAALVFADFPRGSARPDIAIPIVVRHALRGIAVYGRRDGDAALDPVERGLLERLVRAAGSAYEAIEAEGWRRRALAGSAAPAFTPISLEPPNPKAHPAR